MVHILGVVSVLLAFLTQLYYDVSPYEMSRTHECRYCFESQRSVDTTSLKCFCLVVNLKPKCWRSVM